MPKKCIYPAYVRTYLITLTISLSSDSLVATAMEALFHNGYNNFVGRLPLEKLYEKSLIVVDQTHPVLAYGKLVLKKTLQEFDHFFQLVAIVGNFIWLPHLRFFSNPLKKKCQRAKIH